MEAENSRKTRLQAQVRALHSGNKRTILEALETIRQESEPFIIRELIDLLPEQVEPEISEGIFAILNDLKSQEAVPVLMECIQDPEYAPLQEKLLSACWQNGLNYGAYASVFAGLVTDAPYSTAIEALTVLEECLGELDEVHKKELAARAENKAVQADDSRSGLILSMVKMIRSY